MTISYFAGSVHPDSSHDSVRQQKRDQLRGAIQELLRATSLNPQRRICPHCGREMQHIDATCSLYGSETQWKVQLPVCSCSVSVRADVQADFARQADAAEESDHGRDTSSA